MTDVQARYAELEEKVEAQKQRRVRRTPWVLITVLDVLILLVAGTAVVDLRRLARPQGVAEAWVLAALIGDCRTYDQLAVDLPASDFGAGSRACRGLREASSGSRDSRVRDVTAREVTGTGQRRAVRVEVRLVSQRYDVSVPERRSGGKWRVAFVPDVCDPLPCP